MRSTDASAKNLFGRLFTFAPRPTPELEVAKQLRRRNALEDFCTEALAWCLLRSRAFADRLLALDCFTANGFRPETFDVETQLSFTGEDTDDGGGNGKPRRGRFDLVIKSLLPSPALAVIECKVALDKRENIEVQIADYRRHIAGGAFKKYRRKLTLLLTPYWDKYKADAHLSWGQVREALLNTVKTQIGPEKEVLNQFAEFLEIRYLAKMKLPSITPLLPALKKVGPLFAGLQGIFEGLHNDDVVRAIFRKGAMIPNMDWDKDKDRLWYGIWSRGPRPNYFVGLYTSCSGTDALSMWVQVLFDGDRTTEVVPKTLRAWYNKGFSGREDDATNFVFTQKIKSDDENSAAIEEWFLARLHDVKTWADTLV